MNLYYVMGGIMIVSGIVINITVNRRRFYRSSALGMQQFRTYSGKVFTKWVERLLKMIAIGLILLGLGALITGYSYNKQRTRAQKPVHRER